MNGGNQLNPGTTLAKEARSVAVMQREVEDLRKDLDRLLMINEAMWRIMRDRLQCTDAELVRLIHDIDLEDGHLNGRKGPSPQRLCPNCQCALGKHRPTCLFCGTPVEYLPFES